MSDIDNIAMPEKDGGEGAAPPLTAEQLVSDGNVALQTGDNDGAIQAFSRAINLGMDTCHRLVAYQKRASAYNQVGNHAAALSDASSALELDATAAQADLIRGIALFGLKRPAEARAAFLHGQEVTTTRQDSFPGLRTELAAWLRKVTDSAPAGDSAPAPVAPRKPRYEWYQTATHLTLSFLVKSADPATSSVVIGEDCRSLSVSLPLPDSAEWVCDIDLYDEVMRGTGGQPEALSVRPSKVEVRLAKASTAAYTWPSLEATSASVPPAAVKAKMAGSAALQSTTPVAAGSGANSAAPAASLSSSSSRPAYPSSSGKKKDWGALEKELADEEKEKGEGEEALMKLFKQIYSGGDENTRRAMVKSFQTSGGTVLSTNWKEVAKEDYEKDIKAPEGQIAKKWGQE